MPLCWIVRPKARCGEEGMQVWKCLGKGGKWEASDLRAVQADTLGDACLEFAGLASARGVEGRLCTGVRCDLVD